MAARTTYPIFKAFTDTGDLAVGYLLHTYKAGTDTPLTTYQDSGGTVPHTNPIELNELGEAEIFITEAAKFTLTDPDGATVAGWPVDNISPSAVTAAQVSYVPSGSLASTNVQDAIDELEESFTDLSDQFDTLSSSVDNNLAIGPYGDIWGASMTVSGNVITVYPYSCRDSELKTQLFNAATSTVTIPSSPNATYHIFAVKTVDGAHEIRAYTTEAGVASDSQVVAYRWLGFWQTNGSSVCKSGSVANGVLWWDRFAENTINSLVAAPAGITTSIDISAFIPISRADAILLGAQGSSQSVAQAVAVSSVSGTAQTTLTVYSSYPAASGAMTEWEGTGVYTGTANFIPVLTNNIYWGRAANSADGTTRLAIHAIKLRR